jgi:NTE family protein
VQLRDYQRILGNLSRPEFLRWVHEGELATWPKITMIRDQTVVGQILEDCIIRLKKQRHTATVPRRVA